MRIFAILAFHMTLASLQGSPSTPQSDGTSCKLTILRQLASGHLFSDTLNLSGKYLNELGNYNECVHSKARNGSMKYELKQYRSDKDSSQFPMNFVIGMCTFQVCDDDSLNAFDTFYIQTALQTL